MVERGSDADIKDIAAFLPHALRHIPEFGSIVARLLDGLQCRPERLIPCERLLATSSRGGSELSSGGSCGRTRDFGASFN